jgi:DNA-binding LytR/AlgR family response regulator
MNNINILIVEDDSAIAEDIKAELEFHGYNIVGTFDTGEEAIKFMSKIKPHIAILDIKLKGKVSGVDVATFIDSSIKIPYIFLSDYTSGSIYQNAIKTNFTNYLSKPFMTEQLNLSINLAFDRFFVQKNQFVRFNDCFLVRNGDSFYNISVNEIIYIEYDSNDKRTKIYSKSCERIFIIPTGLEDFLRQFSHPDLLRINRNQIINLKLLSEVNKSTFKATLEYSNKQVFNIGGAYLDKLLLAFTIIKDQERK